LGIEVGTGRWRWLHAAFRDVMNPGAPQNATELLSMADEAAVDGLDEAVNRAAQALHTAEQSAYEQFRA
jgi:hypothetical protein